MRWKHVGKTHTPYVFLFRSRLETDWFPVECGFVMYVDFERVMSVEMSGSPSQKRSSAINFGFIIPQYLAIVVAVVVHPDSSCISF